ncbi:Uncharacterised protein [Vibrio cholerae]|nr:Uncharacterised protein [Vibrio cholerae]CSI91794.1 Uncharacterised protein [Vibrio cholerae]
MSNASISELTLGLLVSSSIKLISWARILLNCCKLGSNA